MRRRGLDEASLASITTVPQPSAVLAAGPQATGQAPSAAASRPAGSSAGATRSPRAPTRGAAGVASRPEGPQVVFVVAGIRGAGRHPQRGRLHQLLVWTYPVLVQQAVQSFLVNTSLGELNLKTVFSKPG